MDDQEPMRKDLCAQCANISWTHLTKLDCILGRYDGLEVYRDLGTQRELSESSCPLCRIFGGGLPVYEHFEGHLWLRCSCLCRVDGEKRAFGPSHHGPFLEVSLTSLPWTGRSQRHLFGITHKHETRFLLAPRTLNVNAVDYTVLRQWLDDCNTLHTIKESHLKAWICSPAYRTPVPGFRLIDCLKRQVINAPGGSDLQYVALSYVWGRSKPAEIDLNALPPTIEDSLTVCVALGFRYLWVDRYCIDDENQALKHVQIGMMGSVYKQAQLVIIALGSSSEHGLPGVGATSRRVQRNIQINEDIKVTEIFSSHHDVEESTWGSRGWTYQEGFFATRRLIFTDYETLFVCNGSFCQESLRCEPITRGDPAPQARDWALRDTLPMGFQRAYPRPEYILNEYSKRTLSYDSDALNACAGMLNTFCNHYFGMPLYKDPDHGTYDLILHWHNKIPGQLRKGFPSWTWAGSTGEKHGIGVEKSSSHTTPRCCEILIPLKNGHLQTVDEYFRSSPLEALPTDTEPTLCVKGRLVPASFADNTWAPRNQSHVQRNLDPQGQPRPCAILSHSDHMEIGVPILLDTEQEHVDQMAGTTLLIIENGFHRLSSHSNWTVFLILKRIGDHYKRIGIAWFRGHDFYMKERNMKAYLKEEPFWHEQSEVETIYLV